MKEKKKIIFFDADGTLWYPKSTKYTKHPVWVWKEHKDVCKVKEEFTLVPTVFETLKKLKKKGIKLVVLSTCPLPPKKANAQIHGNIKHFKLDKFFDEAYGTKDYHDSKGDYIIKILKKHRISKKYALMVGDSYRWDYKPARKRGIAAVLINSKYVNKNFKAASRIKRKINKMSEILRYIK